MAGTGWRTDRSLIRQLLAAPERFDVFQATRLMELDALRADHAAGGLTAHLPVGQGSDAAAEVVRFQGSLSAMPGTNPVRAVERRQGASGRPRYRVRVNFMTLGGPFGPLPTPLVELLVDRVRAGDTAMQDFLDLFTHRLVSLMVRARRAHRPELTNRAPWDTNLGGYLAALCGLGTGHLQKRLGVPDPVLYHHAGLLNRSVPTQHGLERVLADHFGVHVVLHPLAGDWMRLEPEDHTILGRRGDSGRLGRGAVLGTRAWDQGAGILVELTGLTLRQYLSFLPCRRGARELASLVAVHAGPHLAVTLRLRLRDGAAPALRLQPGRPTPPADPSPPPARPGRRGHALGRTSWLVGRGGTTQPALVRLGPPPPGGSS